MRSGQARVAVKAAFVLVGAVGCVSLDGFSGGPAPTSADAGGPTNASPRSCKDLTTTNPPSLDGFYNIDPDGDGPLPEIEVYCDMTTAGGGWVLVGRSVTSGSGAFGWTVARGNPRSDDAPYSLDVASASLAFTEILLGTHDGTKQLAGNAYTIAVPSSFLTANASSAVSVVATTVVGSCKSPGGPTMLRFAGHTSNTVAFFFRDMTQPNDSSGFVYGLHANQFGSGYDDCTNGALLKNKQGEIFVR